MSEEKKIAATEEVKEEVRKLTEEELEQVTGGVEHHFERAPVDSSTAVPGGPKSF